MTVYYVNPATGSNQQQWNERGHAVFVVLAVESLKLQPGDSVLLAAGSVFNDQLD
jgi:polysaccharidase protein